MNPTITSIVNSSHLPMSIIIIGVGKEDFTQMEILDGDNGLVDSNSRRAMRDLVQFVPFE
jgi:copine 1/2/3